MEGRKREREGSWGEGVRKGGGVSYTGNGGTHLLLLLSGGSIKSKRLGGRLSIGIVDVGLGVTESGTVLERVGEVFVFNGGRGVEVQEVLELLAVDEEGEGERCVCV